jgi:uncharacterized peroxidase-related enzyme
MAILPLEKADASPAARAVYESIERTGARPSNFIKMLGHAPAILSAFGALQEAVWADGALSGELKDLAYLRASILNGCYRCTLSHTTSSRRRGYSDEQIAALNGPEGRRRADLFSPIELAVLRFTDHLTSRPGNIDPADLQALAVHLNPAQVVELVATIATANWTNRINEGLLTPPG